MRGSLVLLRSARSALARVARHPGSWSTGASAVAVARSPDLAAVVNAALPARPGW